MSLLELFARATPSPRRWPLLLLAMSVASWVVILWKAWLLRRAAGDVARSTAAFWQAPSLDEARQRVAGFDREPLVLPLIAATQAQPAGSLAAAGDRSQQLTRVLRDALHACSTSCSSARCCWPRWARPRLSWACSAPSGASTTRSPASPARARSPSTRSSGPVGEALIMTAAGLAVAIPAVLGYNVFGRLHRPHRGRPGRLRARPARAADAPTPPAPRPCRRPAMAFGRLERTAGRRAR